MLLKKIKIILFFTLLCIPLWSGAQTRYLPALRNALSGSHSRITNPQDARKSYSLQKKAKSLFQPGWFKTYIYDTTACLFEHLVSCTYDHSGRPTSYVYTDSLGNNPDYKETYVYDSLGGYVYTDYLWSGYWIVKGVDTVKYDKRGNKTLEVHYANHVFNYELMDGRRTTYIYDRKGNDSFEMTMTNYGNNTSWGLYQKIWYTTHPDGSWDTRLIINGDSDFTNHIEWHSFADKIMSNYQNAIHYNGFWLDSMRYHANYDINEGYTTLEQIQKGGTWIDKYIQTITTDSFENITSYKRDSWDGNSWSQDYLTRYVLTYNKDGNLIRSIDQGYYPKTKSFISYSRADYGNYINYTALEPNTKTSEGITIYPNPATESINIKTESILSSESVLVEIYDIQGRKLLILNSIGSAPQGGIKIPLSEMRSGTYLARINLGGHQVFQKFQKL